MKILVLQCVETEPKPNMSFLYEQDDIFQAAVSLLLTYMRKSQKSSTYLDPKKLKIFFKAHLRDKVVFI